MTVFAEISTTNGLITINTDAIALIDEYEEGGTKYTRIILRISNGISNGTGRHPRVLHSTSSYADVMRAIREAS